MPPYHQFSAAEFAEDELFIQWVLHPDAVSDLYWRRFLQRWPAQHDAVRTARRLVLALRAEQGAPPPEGLEDRLWNRIVASIEQASGIQAPVPAPNAPHAKRLLLLPVAWLRVAAVLLICAVGAYLLFQPLWTDEVVLHTAAGERKLFSLPDGSSVLLNESSELRFEREWAAGADRTVQLKGEAYFAVKPARSAQGKAKFTVATQDVTVQVLGTRFNVKEQPRGATEVTLSEGRIRLAWKGQPQPVDLQSGEQVAVAAEQPQPVVRRQLAAAEAKPEWVQRQPWKLDQATLASVADLIQSTYNVVPVIEDQSLRTQTVSGLIPTQDLRVVRAILEDAMGLQTRLSNDSLYIDRR